MHNEDTHYDISFDAILAVCVVMSIVSVYMTMMTCCRQSSSRMSSCSASGSMMGGHCSDDNEF